MHLDMACRNFSNLHVISTMHVDRFACVEIIASPLVACFVLMFMFFLTKEIEKYRHESPIASLVKHVAELVTNLPSKPYQCSKPIHLFMFLGI